MLVYEIAPVFMKITKNICILCYKQLYIYAYMLNICMHILCGGGELGITIVTQLNIIITIYTTIYSYIYSYIPMSYVYKQT